MVTMLSSLLLFLIAATVQQPPRRPDVNAQREAMKKLGFLIGRWSGHGRMLRATGESINFTQTEHVEYKLDGLLLVIEGVGRAESDGQPVLQAYGIASYDDATGKYHMRAFNNGRWLETEINLADNGKGLTWSFTIGDIRTRSRMYLTDAGEWSEIHEMAIGSQPPKKFMELTVRPIHPR